MGGWPERGAAADREALAELLHDERKAAIRADVDALTALQPRKRAVLARLAAGETEGPELDRLAHRARQNVALMRHMLDCMRGLAGLDHAGTYAPDGSLETRPGRARGAL